MLISSLRQLRLAEARRGRARSRGGCGRSGGCSRASSASSPESPWMKTSGGPRPSRRSSRALRAPSPSAGAARQSMSSHSERPVRAVAVRQRRELRDAGTLPPRRGGASSLQSAYPRRGAIPLAQAYPMRSSTGISWICGGCRWSQRMPCGRSYARSTSIAARGVAIRSTGMSCVGHRQVLAQDLDRVDGGRDHGLVRHPARLGQQRVLEVAEAAALADPGALQVDRHRAAQDRGRASGPAPRRSPRRGAARP